MVKGAHSKGKAKEREFCEWLMSVQPDIIAWTPPMGKYGSNDIFGVWDVVCLDKTIPGAVFIQICHPNSVAAHRKRINKWMKEFKYRPTAMLVTYKGGYWKTVKKW